MPAPTDELAELRRDLLFGDWRRLDDPRLDLVALERPDLWPPIVRSCAHGLVHDAVRVDTMSIRDWTEAVAPEAVPRLATWERFRSEPLAPDSLIEMALVGVPRPQRGRALLAFVRRVVARRPSPDQEAALTVLERWPS